MNTLPVCGWLECLYSYVETATKNVCSWVALLIDGRNVLGATTIGFV